MADSMRDIKRRIKSVSSTKQITHAMQLVASAKLRHARSQADARRAYTNYIIETMHMISGALEREEPGAFFKPNGCEKDLYIVVTSDKGLAGGFNSGLLKFTAEAMKQSRECAVMVSGAKGLDYFKRRNYEILGSYIGESDEASLGVANSIGKAATTLFLDGKVERDRAHGNARELRRDGVQRRFVAGTQNERAAALRQNSRDLAADAAARSGDQGFHDGKGGKIKG